MVLRNTLFLERERQEYARGTKQQEKERKEQLERKRRKPISVSSCIIFYVDGGEFLMNWICFYTLPLSTKRKHKTFCPILSFLSMRNTI
jgi:hypothetical protein